MAGVTRYISTKLVLDGDKEYNAAIRSINAEQKTLNSELKLLESQYKGNANSLEALTAKGEAYQRILDLQNKKLDTVSEHLEKAKKAYDDFSTAGDKSNEALKQNEAALEGLDESTRKSGEEWAKYAKQIEASQGKLKSLQNSTGDTGAEQEKLRDKIAKAQAEMEKLESSTNGMAKTAGELVQENERLNAEYGKSQSQMQGASDRINQLQSEYNKAKTAVNNTDAALKQNTKYMDEAKNSADGTATSIDEFGNKVDKSASALDALSSALAAAGVVAGLKKIAEALKEAIDASVEFESAITGVYKTVDGTEKQLAAISDGIKQLSTVIPASTTEIAAVAEAAGQLGIATDDVLNFTEVMINLGVATNLSSEEAATALARVANIAGTQAADYERLGSTIVALGNNFATTESEITQMATNLASAGTLAGLTEPQIMALAAAMSSVGIQAAAGGTAMTQTLTAIEKAVVQGGNKLEQFAKIAGMASDEFSAAWQDNAIVAIQAFIAGLGDLESQGESATLVLDDLGLSGVRQSNMLKSLSLASDELAGAIELSSAAWAKNTALTDEAALRYGTLESKLQLLENSTTLLKQAVGDALAPALESFVEVGTDATLWAADFLAENEGLVQAVTILTATLGVFVGGAVGLAGLLKILPLIKTAIIGVNAAMAANPIGAAIVAVATVTTAVIGLIAVLQKTSPEVEAVRKEFEETKKASEEFAKALESDSEKAENLARTLNKLIASSDESAASQLAIKNVTEELVSLVPELTEYINEETGALEGNWQQSIEATAQRKAYAEALEYEASISAQAEGTKQRLIEVEAELAAMGVENEVALSGWMIKVMEFSPHLDEQAQKILDLTLEQQDYNKTLGEMEDELSLAQLAVLGFQEVFGKQAEEADVATQAIQGIVGEMKALENAYNEAYDEAYKSIDGQIGLFELMEVSVDKSVEDMIASLESQIAYMDTYADNMAKAAALGIDEGLLAKLSDGSVQSAAYLQAIVDGGEEKVAALNEKFAGVEEGKEAFAEQTALLVTDFDAKMADIEKRLRETVDEMNQSTEAARAAEDTMQGYLNGIDGKTGALYTKMQSVAKQAIASFRKGLETSSPSKAMRRAGHDTADGYILGVEDKQSEISDIMKRAAELAVEAFGEGFEETAELAKKAMEEYQSYADSMAESLKATIDEIQNEIDEVMAKQEAMASKLADYGELYKKTTISWSDGSKTEYNQLTDFQEQIDTLRQYEETLSSLRERGISESLLSEVVGMGVDEAIEYGRLLMQQNDKQWDEYNSKYEEKQGLAQEIAEKFYKGELDTLETEYADKLQESLDILHDVAYSSGEETVRNLIEGMKAKEAELEAQAQRIAAIVASAASASIDGSHAGGLSYVPFDGYLAELHQGERVLTAEEAQEYMRRAIPTTLEAPQQTDSRGEDMATLINAIGTLAGGSLSAGSSGDLTLVINQNGVEFYRATLADFRQVESENPIEVNDF